MNEHDDDRLYGDPELAGFYDIENTGRADFDYCLGLAADAGSVLDLGCGTGQLAAELTEGRHVTGVDPARAMLDVARERPGGDRVEWIEADARDLRLGRRFDLVLLTGHAFQVFLTGEDQRAVLATIAHHLEPDGRFIFDTRNPAAEEWREWTPDKSERQVEHPRFGPVKAWNDVQHHEATGIATYWTFYELSRRGQVLSAESRIAFPEKHDLSAMIGQTGLAVETWLGDWTGSPWTPRSPEIIPIGRLA